MKLAYIILGVLLAVGVAVIWAIFIRKSGAANPAPTPTTGIAANPGTNTPEASADPRVVWLGLRNMILNLGPREFGVDVGSDDTYGFVMEMGRAEDGHHATVVALRDGTASLYLSTGGGILGTGQKSPTAASISKQAVAAVKQFVPQMEKTTTFPIAGKGRVRFFILTGQGVYTTESSLDSLTKRQDRFTPLFFGGHNVLAQIRLANETYGQSPPGGS